MLVGSCLFIFYISKGELPTLRSPAAMLTLYQKAELYEAMIGKSLDKAVAESSDFSKVKENFEKNFKEYSSVIQYLIPDDLKPGTPVFEKIGDNARVTFKDVELKYKNPGAGVVFISYKFDIVKEASMVKPLGK
jgi:hypothetical protein